jgi:NADH-quinone oxidoreductase subunit N
MNASLMILELCVIGLGLALLLADFWAPAGRKKYLAYTAIAVLGGLLIVSFSGNEVYSLFGGAFINDALAVFFKRLFLMAAILVLFIAAEFSSRIAAAASEYYSLILFALAGMLLAASANDFVMLFVSLELITITFYVLVSFQRSQIASLEAGVKYLILSALSSAFLIFGIALVWGTTGEMNFTRLADFLARTPEMASNQMFLLGVLLVMVGLGFKIAAFPFQIWAPDVYQGAPTPTTAFLAIGSKAAGFVLLLRVLFTAIPSVTAHGANLLIIISGLTILYGNLGALPQRNLKRLLGYSSISHAGFMLLGVAALSVNGVAAVLYYLAGYLFTVLAAFAVIAIVMKNLNNADISGLAGLNRRSPLLAATLAIAMVSLAGIPPLAGFFGKFLLLKAVLEQGPAHPAYYCLAFTALVGVAISLYYYFGVVRAIYWSQDVADLTPIQLSVPAKCFIWAAIAGIFWLGLFPNTVLNWALGTVQPLGL